jgi:D-inositol-3-phosphate glycosyltransferase
VTWVRITYIGPVPPLRSGIAHHGGRLTEALARTDAVTVLSWQHQYPRLLFRRPQRDPDARPHPTARFMLRWWDPLSWWRAGRIAARGDIVVIAWTTPVHALAYRVIMALARRRRIVGIVHNAVPHETLPLQRPLTRWILSRCDGIVTHAGTVAAELSELAGPVETITTPMPANVDVETRPLPPTGEVRLLFFGFIRPYKGLDVALDALALLRERGAAYHLTVVGEPWDPDEAWSDEVAGRGLTGLVDLQLRYVPDSSVSDLIARHHAVVLPYRTASQSGIAPAALAAGRPVVASAVGGLTEVVIDGVNGTLARPGDAASLADAIERCVRDLPALASRASENAPTWSETAEAVKKAAGVSPW